MIFVFLDEFGHSGPYFGKDHAKHNTSPVFGLAGYLMPESQIRGFGTYFIQRKKDLLSADMAKAGKLAYEWEKKGTNLFTATSIERYPKIRDSMFRMMSEIKKRKGYIFYYGREKIRDNDSLNANGLYTTVFSHAIRKIDAYCEGIGENFVIVLDENSARKELLVTAAKTMFGNAPARRMISPPFEVESHLNQNIQAADWIATITGRLWNYRLDEVGFHNYQPYEKYFWTRLHSMATHSTIMRRAEKKVSRAAVGTLGHLLKEAQDRQITAKLTTTVTEEISVKFKS